VYSQRLRMFWLVILVLSVVSVRAFSETPTTRPVLARMLPLAEPTEPRAEFDRILPRFDHEPFDRSGFNAMSLPFRYADPDGVGDRFEADAFAFLLDSALGWAPGNYSARSAYFVFERSGEPMRKLELAYDPKVIQQFISHWGATHAIGGILTRSKRGIAGILEIYDSAGALAFTKKYA
jgi:hypothetical protein